MNDEKPVTGYFLNLTDDERHELISGVLSNIDFSKVRRALEHAAKFLTNFSLERVLRGIILKTAEDRLQSGELNKDGARHLTEHRDEFLSSFDTIMGWPDNPEHRQVALTAILSAFAIALRGQVQEELIQELRQALTKPAHEGRRASRVQEIIELRARALWGGRPSYKDTDLGTAKTILPAVTNDLIGLLKDNPQKIPQKWRPVETPNEDDNKKAISRIARRLKRISRGNR